MRRRRLLATAGTAGALGTAGCLGLLGGGSCGPGETKVADLRTTFAEANSPSSAAITGTVARYVDPPKIDVTGDVMVLDDTTGRALVYPPRAFEFDVESLPPGTCVTVDTSLNESRSNTLELPVFMLQSAGGIAKNGSGPDDLKRYPPTPDAKFGWEWTQANSYEGIAVTITYDSGPPIPAEKLLCKHQGEKSGRESYYWHERGDGVAAGERVEPGDSIHVDAERGALVWDHAEEWKRPLVLWPAGRWTIRLGGAVRPGAAPVRPGPD